jgi:hypothetical protein
MIFASGTVKCIALNVVRGLSMLGLILLIAANAVVMSSDIKALHHPSHNATHDDCEYFDGFTSIPNQPSGAFRSFLNRILIFIQVGILLWSEIGFPQWIIKRWLPILDTDHSLLALGFFEVCISASFMSQFLDNFPLGAAFILFIAGLINMCLFWVERPRYYRSATFWLSNSVLSKLEEGSRGSEATSVAAASIFTAKERPQYGFGRQDDHPAYVIQKPPAAAPPHYSPPSMSSVKRF